jgi:hypothetical protein
MNLLKKKFFFATLGGHIRRHSYQFVGPSVSHHLSIIVALVGVAESAIEVGITGT